MNYYIYWIGLMIMRIGPISNPHLIFYLLIYYLNNNFRIIIYIKNNFLINIFNINNKMPSQYEHLIDTSFFGFVGFT